MDSKKVIPDHTAVRVALWRALHLLVDSSPYVFQDDIGLKLVGPDGSWRERPDMHPEGTKGYRASIVGRARFIEDLLADEIRNGIKQYIILGSGLDTFVQRKPEVASQIETFEIEEPETQAWKQGRLKQIGFDIPSHLHFVPVDFEKGESWIQKLKENGFHSDSPAFVSSAGVAMYLSREANLDTLTKMAKLAPGSILVMTFMLPPSLVESQDREAYEMVMKRAAAAGTPFQGLFTPEEILDLAREAGFRDVRHVSRVEIIKRYFTDREDSLVPSSGEEFLIAKT